MIDISEKNIIPRLAIASGRIRLKKETIEKILDKSVKKGDVFTIAKIAAINAVKKVPDLIPLCHPIPINNINIDFKIEGYYKYMIQRLKLAIIKGLILNFISIVKKEILISKHYK